MERFRADGYSFLANRVISRKRANHPSSSAVRSAKSNHATNPKYMQFPSVAIRNLPTHNQLPAQNPANTLRPAEPHTDTHTAPSTGGHQAPDQSAPNPPGACDSDAGAETVARPITRHRRNNAMTEGELRLVMPPDLQARAALRDMHPLAFPVIPEVMIRIISTRY